MDTDELKNGSTSSPQKKLSPQQYHVMFEKGTEPRFQYKENWKKGEKGMYVCANCGQPLFSSDAEFELDPSVWNSGWPSFGKPIDKGNVELRPDYDYGMYRMEIICKNCGAHIGHLFDDGPKEANGDHYCVNSCALNFKPQK